MGNTKYLIATLTLTVPGGRERGRRRASVLDIWKCPDGSLEYNAHEVDDDGPGLYSVPLPDAALEYAKQIANIWWEWLAPEIDAPEDADGDDGDDAR